MNEFVSNVAKLQFFSLFHQTFHQKYRLNTNCLIAFKPLERQRGLDAACSTQWRKAEVSSIIHSSRSFHPLSMPSVPPSVVNWFAIQRPLCFSVWISEMTMRSGVKMCLTAVCAVWLNDSQPLPSLSHTQYTIFSSVIVPVFPTSPLLGFS